MNIFKPLILLITIITLSSCSVDPDDRTNDKYSGKFPNAQYANTLMPINDGNYWIYKSLINGKDTLEIGPSVKKEFTVFPLFRIADSSNITLTIFQNKRSFFSGFAVSDSGVYEYFSLSRIDGGFNETPIHKSKYLVIYEKTAPVVPTGNITKEYSKILNENNTYYYKEIIKHHDVYKSNNENINDVWEFTFISSENSLFEPYGKTTKIFKRGVGLIEYTQSLIRNDFEVLIDKKYLLSYKLN